MPVILLIIAALLSASLSPRQQAQADATLQSMLLTFLIVWGIGGVLLVIFLVKM